jgi:hypothetical protein
MPIDARISMGLRPQTYDAFGAFNTSRAAARTDLTNQMAQQAAQATAALNRNAMNDAALLDPNDRAAQQQYALRYGAAATPFLTALSGVDTNFAGRGTEARAQGKFETEQSEAYMTQLPRFAAQLLGVTNIPEAAARMRPTVEASGFPTELFDTYVGQLSEMDPAQAQQALQSYLLTTGGGETAVKARYPNRELATTATGQEAVNLSSLALDPTTGAPVPITGPLSVPAEKPIDVVTTADGRLVAVYANGRTQELRDPTGAPLTPAPTDADERRQERREDRAAAKENAASDALSKANLALDTIDLAMDSTNWATAGVAGVFEWVPGSPPKRLAGYLNTIRSNVAFNELQQMRRNSPTGGALGNVSDADMRLLQSTLATLDQLASPEDLRRALSTIKRVTEAVRDAYAQDVRDFGVEAMGGSAPAGGGGTPTAAQIDAEIRRRGLS